MFYLERASAIRIHIPWVFQKGDLPPEFGFSESGPQEFTKQITISHHSSTLFYQEGLFHSNQSSAQCHIEHIYNTWLK